jgi:endonuclease-3 related protein
MVQLTEGRGNRATAARRGTTTLTGPATDYTEGVTRLSPAAQEALIRAFYGTLFRAWGRQHWWPARTRFEVIVGAFLTQNTAWTNVERALGSLRQAGALSLAGVRRTPLPQLEKLVRSAGYFHQKARRLKSFVRFLDARYGGSLDRLFGRLTPELREELLGLDGIGPETADSILLYAGNHPVFVVDAYTRRILERHKILPAGAKYEEVRQLCERALASEAHAETGNCAPPTPPQGSGHRPSPMSTAPRPVAAQVFNEMHGLLVGVGKDYCLKSKALCERCPLGPLLPLSARKARKR